MSSAWKQSSVLITAAAATITLITLYNIHKRYKKNEKNLDENTADNNTTTKAVTKQESSSIQEKLLLSTDTIIISYTSNTGTCEKLAKELYSELTPSKKNVECIPIENVDWWDELLQCTSKIFPEKEKCQIIFLIPTWTNGTIPPKSRHLLTSLLDITNDWRVDKFPLKDKISFAVYGMGSSEYDDEDGFRFCKPAVDVSRLLERLGGEKLHTVGKGDDADALWEDGWRRWKEEVVRVLIEGKKEEECCGGGTCQSEKEDDGFISEDDNEESEEEEPNVDDVEDLILQGNEEKKSNSERKEMVTPKQAKSLRKEGYKLIGSHSAVKLCRWTKNQLRGRGGCYKHTFYGITSYQCMEATPSLACANKCVFCWRHHKNPVGKTWKWKTDEPDFIVKQAIKNHQGMIKETKGIPGVQKERWLEAHTVRHCALSLVGEPIMYPHINRLLTELHNRSISSFLVTNGQHPTAIENLIPVTQLYVSVDAANPASLIEIDRPLYTDAWERLCRSLACLKDKRQRTVARLTVVKGWNEGDVKGYADLISLGACSLIEIKGVTYCGTSGASNLNMSNSPWHHEVVTFSQSLLKELETIPDIPSYGLACEHKHSCCVLLARKDLFHKDGQWHTWIDYHKFSSLVERKRNDAEFEFGVEDYIAPTPSWATFGSNEEGFDPSDLRHWRRKMKYTKFDAGGIPTHDANGKAISEEERETLRQNMEKRRQELGGVDTKVWVRESGEKWIEDVTAMYRGMTLAKEK